MSSLGHWSVITRNNRDDVMQALLEISMGDADFSGENGDEYLWEEAKGFESNADYVLSIASQAQSTLNIIRTFVSMWMDRDCYYVDYDLEISELNGIISISVAYMTD